MHTTYTDRGTRGGAAVVVVAAHIAVIYAVAVSLGVVETPVLQEPTQAVIIDTPHEEPEKFVPETPQVAGPPRVDVPVPEIPVIDVPVETAITVPPAVEAVPTPRPTTVEATSLAVTRRVDPVYPPASRRLDEHGSVRLRVLVDERGRPREVQVAKSSGYDRLDEAAVSAVRRWQFSPATQESRAVTAWTQVNVVFQLNR